jgi:hypothetical protein
MASPSDVKQALFGRGCETQVMTIEEPLQGGTLSRVVRVEDTVRRVVSDPRESGHRLLAHLEAAGFDGAPRFLGMDEQGRETLTFIDGDVTASGPIPGLRVRRHLWPRLSSG